MGSVKVPYLREKRLKKGGSCFWWEPKKSFRIDGKDLPCPMKACSLGKDAAEAIKLAQHLNKRLEEWRAGMECPHQPAAHGTFRWLCDKYEKSQRFADLAPSSRKFYADLFKAINFYIGDVPVKHIKRAYGLHMYEDNKQTLKKAHDMVSTARTVLNYGRDLGLIDVNPFTEMNLSKPDPRSQIWTQEDVQKVCDEATAMGLPSIALATLLAVDTGQRPGDLRLMTWQQYDGRRISLRQSKTGAFVTIPCTQALKAALDSTPRDHITVLIREATGKAYTKDSMSRDFRRACDKAGIDADFQLRDLRRTSVVRLSEAGCTPQEVASITGHSINTVHQILRIYCPRTDKMADNAIERLEKTRKKVGKISAASREKSREDLSIDAARPQKT